MNFKRNCFLISALVGSVFLVAGCSKDNSFKQYKYMNFPTEVYDDVEHKDKDGNVDYVKYGKYDSYQAMKKDGTTKGLGSTYDVLYNLAGSKIIEAEGTKNILVVPVKFAGYDLGIKDADYIDNVKKAFFGDASNNRYVSVAEYYNRSSYGKLRIKGKVCDQFYTFQKPWSEMKSYSKDDVKNAYQYVTEAGGWHEKTYHASLDEFKVKADGDPAVYFVYAYPVELKDKANPEFFWAYTFEEKPCSWSSYTTMNTLAGKPDAHTFIHEVGHLLGLKDYYPSGSEASTPDPTGKIDMMDCSVGDHSALSKMVLNWAKPYHVIKSCEIKLKPLINNGDIILIKNDWNKTVFDEYFLIEFYTPLGLNYFDSNIGNSEARLPSLPGIKIYHVDARLGYFNRTSVSNPLTFMNYCNVPGIADPNEPGVYVRVAHDNSTYESVTGEVPQYQKNFLYELELNNVGHPVAGCATNMNLFREGDSFTIKSTSFNESSNTFYKIEIKNVGYSNATVSITKTN